PRPGGPRPRVGSPQGQRAARGHDLPGSGTRLLREGRRRGDGAGLQVPGEVLPRERTAPHEWGAYTVASPLKGTGIVRGPSLLCSPLQRACGGVGPPFTGGLPREEPGTAPHEWGAYTVASPLKGAGSVRGPS